MVCACPFFSLMAEDSNLDAIQKTVDAYTEAFNKGDAAALSRLWTEQAEFQTPAGETLKGRDALRQSFEQYFSETEDARLELADVQIEVISPSVARETGTARVLVPEQEPSETAYEAIHVKTASGWKIDRVTETEPETVASNYDKLKELEWLIGTWVDRDENSTIETTCRWTTNRNFIQRSFRVVTEDGVEFEGTQIIGWDPAAETIRSWLFDSDGGFAIARWTNTGAGQWTVQTLSVMPDGSRASSTNVYDLLDENTVQFKSIGRSVAGELLPNLGPVTVARVAQ
jgi:uncharacterized protein (TIGR02246 family)